MNLKHYVFEFKGSEKTESLDLNRSSNIFVVINGIETKIRVEELFLYCEIDDDDITGYSVLQLLAGNKLVIDEKTTLEITFIENGKPFYISKIRRPFMYDGDVVISNDERLLYVDLLLNAIKPDAVLSGDGALTNETPSALETAEVVSKVLGGLDWDEFRTRLISLGLTEVVYGDYRFFKKENQIAFYLLVKGDFIDITLFDEGNENYSFEYEGKENELIFKNDKLTIKQLV